MITTPIATGTEFQVNTTTALNQRASETTSLADGSFVVTWESYNQDGSALGIFGQHFATDGSAIGNEFQINTYSSGNQQFPAIAGLSDGGFVVTWASYGQDGSSYGTYGQRYSADGSANGSEFQVNTNTSGGQLSPSITALADGGFVITWASQDIAGGDSYGINGQRFAADGSAVGSEFLVNSTTDDLQDVPSVTALADGGFVVVWQSLGQDGSGQGVFGQRFGADGLAMGGEFQVNTRTFFAQSNPSIAALADGGFIVTWESSDQDGSPVSIFAQRYGADGAAVDGEFRVNSYSTGNQTNPSVTELSDGGFVITWQSMDQDGEWNGIFGQRYGADGSAAGYEFLINTTTAGQQYNVSAVPPPPYAALPNLRFDPF